LVLLFYQIIANNPKTADTDRVLYHKIIFYNKWSEFEINDVAGALNDMANGKKITGYT